MASAGTFSIARQVTVLVIGVCLASLVLHAWLTFNFVGPAMTELIGHLASETRLVCNVLRRSVPEDRDKVARALSLDQMTVSRLAPSDLVPRRPWQDLDMPPELLNALLHELGPDMELVEEAPTARDGARLLHIGVLVDGETWWVHHRLPGRSVAWTALPLVAPLVLLVLAGALASLTGVRLITRPMSRLSADMLARRTQLTTIEPASPVGVELAGVVKAFNEMVLALRRSDQSRRNLLAGVSHDLRTPLARLRLRAELECAEPVFQAMEADFQAVAHIIEQFLAYAQGHGPTEVGAREPLIDVLRQCVSRYAEAGQAVALGRLDTTHLTVPSMSMQRLLGNLIDNALSHGVPPVEVELHLAVSGYVDVWVFDQGRGIAADAFEQALLPFIKLARVTDERGHCGLGLAIVNQIATMLNGQVVLYPHDGRRAGVGVRLPV